MHHPTAARENVIFLHFCCYTVAQHYHEHTQHANPQRNTHILISYSYEDLPSDKLGAEFGANYFNPESELSLGEQLYNYLQGLGATMPEKASNYKDLPQKEPQKTPSRINKTTIPVYTKNNP